MTIAAASASAAVASTALLRQPGEENPHAKAARSASASVRPGSAKPPKSSSKAFADGFRKGYAAGSAAGRKQAAAKCAPQKPDARHTTENDLPAERQGVPLSETAENPVAVGKHGNRVNPLMHSGMNPGSKKGPMPAPLRGSSTSLQRQNTRLEHEGLERIEDQRDLDARIASHLLVPVPASDALVVNQKLPANRRYCRPWTARFLSDLAEAHAAAFHEPIEVNSAVRTVAYQKRLRRANSNAAPAKGNIVSPHLTGAAVDIAKEQLSRQEIAWMRRELLPLQKAGKIDVEEEFQQACFHITVYKGYDQKTPAPPPHNRPAQPEARRAATGEAHQTSPKPPKVQPAQAQPTKLHPQHHAAPHAEPTEVIVAGQ